MRYITIGSPRTDWRPTRSTAGSLVPAWLLAGGFLTGKYERGKPVPADTRFARSPSFYGQRLTDANFDRLDGWRAFAQTRGRSMGELAVAWLASHPEVCSVIAALTDRGAAAPSR